MARTPPSNRCRIDTSTSASKTQRPKHCRRAGDGFKLHLRVVRAGRSQWRLLSLRPHTAAVFSTNYFHDTWHILSDTHGARLLARLLWGLSFQRRPGTAVLLHGEHIQPTPFGAEASDPILLVRAGQTNLTLDALRGLHAKLAHLGPSQRTVRWRTFGLDKTLEQERSRPRSLAVEQPDQAGIWHRSSNRLWAAEQMFRRGGFLCYVAPPMVLQQRAVAISQLNPTRYGMDYYFLADHRVGNGPDGEVQVFSDYQQRCSAAAQARRQILHAGRHHADPNSLYEAIAARRDFILRRRR